MINCIEQESLEIRRSIYALGKTPMVADHCLIDTISACVIATNQTYVEALKKGNAFTKEAQEEAFKQTYEAVMAVLTDEAKKYLTAAYGDLTAYITNKIEAEVNLSKIVPAE